MKLDSPKNIKAFLLAAGLGTRLRPITDSIPKCLVRIGDKPLLGHWMESLTQADVGEVLVNTHWLAEQVEAFAQGWNPKRPVLQTFYEPDLLGSAGTIAANAGWVSEADAVLVIYADNFSRFELRRLLDYHFAKRSELTLGVFNAPEPRRCGIVEVDDDGRGVSFEEKPINPKSNLAAAGLYVLSPSIINEIREIWEPVKGVFDLGSDVFPRVIRRARIFPIDEPLIDIGTIEAYEKVCRAHQTPLINFQS